MQNTYDGVNEALGKIYAKNGLSDNYPIKSSAIDNLKDLKTISGDYTKKAQLIGDEEGLKLANNVNNTVNNFYETLKQNEGQITYGEMQHFKNYFNELAGDYLKQNKDGSFADTTESKMLSKLSKSLSDSQVSDPLIKKVHAEYGDLSDARDTLGRVYKLADEQTGDISAERAGLRQAGDLGNLFRRGEIDKVENTVAKYDETKDLSGFSTPVKIAQEAMNMQKATPTGTTVSLWQDIKKTGSTVNPLSQKFLGEGGQKVNTIANLVKNGTIPPEALGTYFKRSSITGIGEPINRLRAYSNLLDLKNRLSNLGNKGMGTYPLPLSIMSLINQESK